MKKLSFVLALAFLLVPVSSQAKKFTFDVKSKFVNITFESRMAVEDILGTTNQLEGHFEWSSKSDGSFVLKVPVESLKTGIDMRDKHLQSKSWLDAKNHPHIVLKGDTLKHVKRDQYKVEGKLTMHGVTKPFSTTVSIRRIPASVAAKQRMGDAEWIRVRADFKVKLSDFNVTIPDMAAAKVNDEWSVKVSLFGKEVK